MALLHYILALLLAPLLPGVINRVKAKFGGRRGRPYLQVYYDLAKLFRKGAVYSTSTTWVFRAGPLVGLGCVLAALCFVPLAGSKALMGFTGDFLLAAYFLGMARFATICAALDTGSAFEGMGASREATFSALVEPVFLLGMVPLGMTVKNFSLSFMLAPFTAENWVRYWPVLFLLGSALFLVLLTENSRIPVDDPTTHLELTMIHEVMVLDHGGVDLALIEYAASLKLWFFSAVVVGVLLPDIREFPAVIEAANALGIPQNGAAFVTGPLGMLLLSLGGIFCVAVLVGVTESIMARLRLVRVPQLLSLAAALTALACLFSLR